MQPKDRRLVTEQNLEDHTVKALAPVNTKIDDTEARLESIETMAGLKPGEVTDAQTANLMQQPHSLTNAALDATIANALQEFGPRNADTSSVALLRARLLMSAVQPVPLLFVGSSTTQSATASAPEAEYPHLVTRAIQAAYSNGAEESMPVRQSSLISPTTTPGVHGYNVGWGGRTSENYLSVNVMNNVVATQPAAVIHAIGANDWYLGNSPETYRTNMRAALDSIDAAVELPVLHVLVHQHSRNVRDSEWVWSDYLDVLYQIHRERPLTTIVVDANTAFEAIGVPGPDPLNVLHADGVHLVDQGYRVLAELVSLAIAQAHLLPLESYVPGKILEDDFDRADSANGLGTALTGQTWEVQSISGQTWGITDGEAHQTSAEGQGFATVDVERLDVTVRAVLGSPQGSGGGYGGLAAWVTDEDNGVYFRAGATQYQLYMISNGTRTLIDSHSAAPAKGDVVEVVVSGREVTTFVNGQAGPMHSNLTSIPRTSLVGFYSSGSAGAPTWNSIEVIG